MDLALASLCASLRLMRLLNPNSFIAYLLCLTLMFRVIVPVGYMPDLNALQHGFFKITICSAHGAKDIWIDQNQNQVDPQHQHQSNHQTGKHDVCSFAGLHASVIPILSFALALLLLLRKVRYKLIDADIRSTVLVSAYPRGPPFHLA